MEPLEKRLVKINDGKKAIDVPALSPQWIEKRKFLHFLSPLLLSHGVDNKEWCDILSHIKSDLHWLLKLSYHKFWSQIIFDKSLHECLVSFLQEAPRFYSEERIILKCFDHAWNLFKEIQNLIFLTFVRMATYKESKENFITPEIFGKLIYDNFVFDVPKMMDLCVLYGPSNSVLLSKMFNNIFSHQPKYKYDLEETAKSLNQVFHLILGQLGLESGQAAGSVHSGPLSVEELNEVILYILDISATLWYFLDIYPTASSLLIEANIQNQLADFYEKSIPYICCQIETAPPNEKGKMFNNLTLARKYLIQIYNALLHSTSIKMLFMHSNDDPSWDREGPVENWLDWLTCLVSERQRHFLIDYNLIFPVQDDIDLITQLGIQLDSTRVDYVKVGLKGFKVEFGLSLTPANLRAADGGVDASKMSVLVLQIKELLPDFHEDHIQACLKHYDYNAEAVINAALENNLPPHLTESEMPVIQAVPETSTFQDPTEISKKTRTKTVHFDEMREILNDKQDLKNLVLERVDEQIAAEYEDEYDDTYDSHAVGSEEPDAHNGEEEFRRSFVVPRVLQPKLDYESEEEEDIPQQAEERPRDQFVQNPEELRALAEQRRLSRRGHRFGPSPAQRNVVGAPKGQGQEKDTIAARRHKGENKSRGANHNRRFMADRKRREF